MRALELRQLPQKRLVLFVELGGHLDRDFDQQVAAAAVSRAGHSETGQLENIAGLRARRNRELAEPVQRRHLDRRSERRLRIADGNVTNQVLAVSLEQRMRGDRNKAVAIAGRPAVGTGLALALQAEPGVAVDPGGDFDFAADVVPHEARPVTLRARILDRCAGAFAARAGGLHREDAGRLDDAARTAAVAAGFGLGARPRAASAASGTRAMASELDGLLRAPRRLLQADSDLGADVGALVDAASAATHSAAEKVAEDIAEGGKDVVGVVELGGPARAADARVAVTVVASPFLAVAEHVEGLGGLLEFFGRFVVALIAIGMKLHRHIAIAVRDLIVGGRARDSQHFVIIAFDGHRERILESPTCL